MSPEHRTAASAGGDGLPAAGNGAGHDFPKRYRLTKTDEYSSVFGFRRTLKSTHFLLHYRPRPDGEGARLGVVVPKKLVKAAVRRNLIKRLAREQFRLNRRQLPAFDLVLRLAAKPGRPERKSLAAEILGLLLKLGRQQGR